MPTTNTALNTALSTSSMPLHAPLLLVVDDDRTMRMLLSESLQRNGYHVQLAGSGEEALRILAENPARIDAVVLDREMPGLSGLEVVAQMKGDRQLATIPVIMLTGSGMQEKIQEGIDAGVFYYLVKPTEDSLLYSVIGSALRERQQKRALISELNRHGQALKAMRSCHITLRTLSEAEDTACFLASCFPDPERVVSGLLELLINSVEHGNLGIAFEEKTRLLDDNIWREEIDRRAMLPEYSGRVTDVLYQRQEDGFLVQITDSGAGFDWKRFWHINPARATSSHGRGIARARLLAFDRLAYNEAGNQVTVMVSATPVQTQEYAW